MMEVGDGTPKGGTRKTIILLSLLFAILMVFSGIYDLGISRTVVNLNSATGRFVQYFGGVPGMVLVEFAFFMLAGSIGNSDIKAKYVKLFLITVVCTAIPFFSFQVLFLSMKNRVDFFRVNRFLFIIFFTVISILMIYLFRTFLHRFSEKNRFFSSVTVKLFLFSYTIIVPVLKYFSGRIRFKELGEGFAGYSPWYLFNGPNGNFSFPSGHAVLAWMLLPLILLFSKSSNFIKIVVTTIVIFWGIFVSVNRVLYGAHFLSDVLFSTGVTVILFIFLSREKRDS